jgi:hypothetical protein
VQRNEQGERPCLDKRKERISGLRLGRDDDCFVVVENFVIKKSHHVIRDTPSKIP